MAIIDVPFILFYIIYILVRLKSPQLNKNNNLALGSKHLNQLYFIHFITLLTFSLVVSTFFTKNVKVKQQIL